MTRDRFTASEWLIHRTIVRANTMTNELYRMVGVMVVENTITADILNEHKKEIDKLNKIVSALDLM